MNFCIEYSSSKISSISPEMYYKEIIEKDLDTATTEIDLISKSASNREVISKGEYNYMAPKEKGPGKFYQIFKFTNRTTHQP
jgi:hypothetical protein